MQRSICRTSWWWRPLRITSPRCSRIIHYEAVRSAVGWMIPEMWRRSCIFILTRKGEGLSQIGCKSSKTSRKQRMGKLALRSLLLRAETCRRGPVTRIRLSTSLTQNKQNWKYLDVRKIKSHQKVKQRKIVHNIQLQMQSKMFSRSNKKISWNNYMVEETLVQSNNGRESISIHLAISLPSRSMASWKGRSWM
jgi:hypothetical protein